MSGRPELIVTINASSATLAAQPLKIPLPSNFGDTNSIVLTDVTGSITVPIATTPPSMLLITSDLFVGDRLSDTRFRTIDSANNSRTNTYPHFAVPVAYNSSIASAGNVIYTFSWSGRRTIKMPHNQRTRLMNPNEESKFYSFVLKQDTVSGVNITGGLPEDFPSVDLQDGKAFQASNLTFSLSIERDQGKAMIYDQGRTAINHITPTF